MKVCKFDDSLLREERSVPWDFPYKDDIMEVFHHYGYNNECIAAKISKAAPTIDPMLQKKYNEVLEIVDIVVRLKLPSLQMIIGELHVSSETVRDCLLAALKERVLGKDGLLSNSPYADEYSETLIAGACRSIFEMREINYRKSIRGDYRKVVEDQINIQRLSNLYNALLNQYSVSLGLIMFKEPADVERIFMERLFESIKTFFHKKELCQCSNYIVSQYIHFVMTGNLIAPGGYIAEPIAAAIHDILVVYGLKCKKDDDYSPKQKKDRIKNYFIVDKESGQYTRMI